MISAAHGPVDARIAAPTALRGELRVPGDKSISHRAALFNAVASGPSRLEGYSPGEDCRSTLASLAALGVSLQAAPDDAGGVTVDIEGGGLHGLVEPDAPLDAGNSGTTVRLLAGLLAGQEFLTVLDGDESLRRRPMLRVVAPLRSMGATILGRLNGDRLPLAIRGGELRGCEHHPAVASAQVKSALLLAGLYAAGPTTVVEVSPTRDHTERLLRAQGVRLEQDGVGVTLWPPGQKLNPVDLSVPGDPSSAAYWIALACIHPDAQIRVRGVALNPGRVGFFDVLQVMGGRVAISNLRSEGGEPVGDLTAESSDLSGLEVGGDLIARLIDEVPLLAVTALFATGATRIRDAIELRVKESDRLSTTARELSRMGASVQELPDGLVIEGGRSLGFAEVDSHADHRLAMCLAVAGMAAQGVAVRGADACSVSYPSFWDHAEQLGAVIER